MMKRPTMALPLCAALLAVVGVAVHQAQAAAKPKVKKPSIGSASINPKSLPGAGGSISVKVKVTSNGSLINSVTARSTLSSSSPGISATLQNTSGSTYSGTVRVQANGTTSKTHATIYVDVQTSSGTVTKKVGTVNLAPGDPNQPPPPPPI